MGDAAAKLWGKLKKRYKLSDKGEVKGGSDWLYSIRPECVRRREDEYFEVEFCEERQGEALRIIGVMIGEKTWPYSRFVEDLERAREWYQQIEELYERLLRAPP